MGVCLCLSSQQRTFRFIHFPPSTTFMRKKFRGKIVMCALFHPLIGRSFCLPSFVIYAWQIRSLNPDPQRSMVGGPDDANSNWIHSHCSQSHSLPVCVGQFNFIDGFCSANANWIRTHCYIARRKCYISMDCFRCDILCAKSRVFDREIQCRKKDIEAFVCHVRCPNGINWIELN